MKLFLLFFLSFLHFNLTQGQTRGCTDIQAINYNPNSTQNDGSCLYRATTLTPQLIHKLPNKLNETSGIVCIKNKIYTHNDAGNETYIYELTEDHDTIIHATKILGLDGKTDFEDIAADNQYIYLCDAGNNKGNRKNLRIIKIALTNLQKDSTEAEKIEFKYPDQKNFSKRDHDHNFDCEALFCWNDTLHLLTKNWLNYYTKHYILSTKPGIVEAQFVDSFNAEMLVTGADINSSKNKIVLCGYDKNGLVNLWLLDQFQQGHIFSGNKKKIELGLCTDIGQVEGVCFNGEDNLYITNEEYISLVEQSLWWVDISNRLGQIAGSHINKELIDDINVLPNKLEHLVNAEIVCKKDFTADVYIVNAQKKILGVLKSRKFTNGYNQVKIEVDELKPGNYILMCIDKNQNIIKTNFSISQ